MFVADVLTQMLLAKGVTNVAKINRVTNAPIIVVIFDMAPPLLTQRFYRDHYKNDHEKQRQ